MGPLLRLNTLGNPLVLLNDGGLYMVGLISRSTISEITSITSVSTGGLEIFFFFLLLLLLLLSLLLLLLLGPVSIEVAFYIYFIQRCF